MPVWLVVTLVLTLFFGVGTAMVYATRRQWKQWQARPSILRAFAARRGYQFVEQPGTPADLAPIRPVEKKGDIVKLELPVAVRGRSLDGDLTLFDIYTQTLTKIPGQRTSNDRYETYLTIRSGARWPHFEFLALSQVKQGSITGVLLELTGGAMSGMMEQRGLRHLPIEGRPGYQLFIENPETAAPLRDALLRQFDGNAGWWVGALGDAVTFMRSSSKSPAMGELVPAEKLDGFVDDAVKIERALRDAITRR